MVWTQLIHLCPRPSGFSEPVCHPHPNSNLFCGFEVWDGNLRTKEQAARSKWKARGWGQLLPLGLVAASLPYNLSSHHSCPRDSTMCSSSSQPYLRFTLFCVGPCPNFLPGSSPSPQAAVLTCLVMTSFGQSLLRSSNRSSVAWASCFLSPNHAMSSSNSNLHAIL